MKVLRFIFIAAAHSSLLPQESFRKKVKDYNDTISDIERLLQTGMFHTVEAKHARVLFDPRYCKMPSLAVCRRISFWMDDFTK